MGFQNPLYIYPAARIVVMNQVHMQLHHHLIGIHLLRFHTQPALVISFYALIAHLIFVDLARGFT